MRYLAGVDSGGTHTNVRVQDRDGETKPAREISSSLTSNRSDEELVPVLNEIFAAIHSLTTSSPVDVWINAAGYSAPTRERFARLVREAAGKHLGAIGIANDAVSLLLAHDEELVIIIAGTGSVAMARQPSGCIVTRGGDEWVVADYGSAFWIGLNGMRAAYRALEGGDDTALLSCLIEQFGLLDAPSLSRHEAVSRIARDLALSTGATKSRIATFATQVTRQAEKGDDVAREIVRRAVDDLASAAARVYRELATAARPRAVMPRFLVSGSVAYFSPFYKEGFRNSLEESLFDVRQSIGHDIEFNVQLNGLAEALVLARRMSDGEEFPSLDERHPYSRFS